MSRLRLSCLIATCVLGAFGTLGAQQPMFRDVGQVVRVFVTVTDRDGHLVTTLKQPDFEVRDDGKPQPITLFDSRPRAMRLVLMLDVSSSMEFNLPLLRAATQEFFKHLRPDDQVRVGSFGSTITISPTFTNDLQELQAALPTSIVKNAATQLWTGIGAAVNAFPSESQERRVVLVMSDGKDTGSMMGGLNFREAETIEHARRADVMVYAVGVRSRGLLPSGIRGFENGQEPDWPDPALQRLAKETGGGYAEIALGKDLGPVLAQIANELHSQYLVGFAPPRRDGRVHKIQIVAARGLKPRARAVYIAPSESAAR